VGGDVGGDIAAVAERLRLVRGARRKFLRLWAIDRSVIDPLVDRLAVDLADSTVSGPHAGSDAGPEEQDPATHRDAPPVDEG
jgi:hypothetical protein